MPKLRQTEEGFPVPTPAQAGLRLTYYIPDARSSGPQYSQDANLVTNSSYIEIDHLHLMAIDALDLMRLQSAKEARFDLL